MSIKGSTTTSDYLDFDATLNKGYKLIRKSRNPRFGFLVVVGINSGLRIGDLLQLSHSDFHGDAVELSEKKTGKRRKIRINDHIRRGYELLLEREPHASGAVFVSNQGSVMSVQYINRKLKEVFGKKSLSISSHSLRKTFGRAVWERHGQTDGALLYLSELFNHSSPAITRKYLGIRQEELDDIYMSLS